MPVIFFILILTLLVFVHELGHFLAARKLGVRVEEFGIGFPPRAIGRQHKGTMYSLNWVPLGGFVKIKGEQGENVDDSDSFSHKNALQRTLILSSGVLMNVLLAWILLTVGFSVGSPGLVSDSAPHAIMGNAKLQVVEVTPQSAAAEQGIAIGDTIVSLEEQPVTTIDEFRSIVRPRAEQTLTITILSEGSETTKSIIPKKNVAGEGIVGVGLVEIATIRYPVPIAIWQGLKSTGNLLWQILVALYTVIHDLFVGQPVSLDLAGPVGIAVLTGQVAKLGILYLVQFAALLSLNLAIINILPFPALDGGRILFVIIEKIRRKPVSKKIEGYVHNAGFALLIALVILITIKDVSKFSGAVSSFFRNAF